MPFYAPATDVAAVATQLLGNNMPKAEAGAAAAGTAGQASRDDHTHPRISWSGVSVTNASGVATFDFSAKPFDTQPAAVLSYVDTAANAQPVILKVNAWVMSAGKYVGCTVQGQRATPVPTNLVSLLLGGVYSLFNGSAAGLSVSVILLPQS